MPRLYEPGVPTGPDPAVQQTDFRLAHADDTFTKLDTVEQHSYGTLPSDVSLGLAQSIDMAELHKASVSIARQLDFTAADIFPRVTAPPVGHQPLDTGQTRVGPKLGDIRDPSTGATLSFSSALRLFKPMQVPVMTSILRRALQPQSSRLRHFEYIGTATPERTMEAINALTSLDKDAVPWTTALSMGIMIAQTPVSIPLVQRNLEISAKVPGLEPAGAVAAALTAAKYGIQFTDTRSVIEFAFPKTKAPLEQASQILHEQSMYDQSRAAQEAAMSENFGIGGGYIPPQPQPLTSQPRSVQMAAGLLSPDLAGTVTDFMRQAHLIGQQVTAEQDDWHHTFAYQALNPIFQGYQTIMNHVSGAFWAGWHTMAGTDNIAMPAHMTGGYDQIRKQLSTQMEVARTIQEGKTTIGTAFVHDMHLPQWTTPIVDLGFAFLLDPTILAGEMIASVKSMRLLTDAPGVMRAGDASAEARAAMVQRLVEEPLYKQRLLSPIRTTARGIRRAGKLVLTGGKTSEIGKATRLSDLLVDATKVTRNPKEYYLSMVGRFRHYWGTNGLDETFAHQVFDFSRAARRAGLGETEIKQAVDGMIYKAFGFHVDGLGDMMSIARDMVDKTVTERAISGIYDRYWASGLKFSASTTMAEEKALVALSDEKWLLAVLGDEEAPLLTGPKLADTVMHEIPHFNPITDVMSFIGRTGLADSGVGRSIAAVLNKTPRGMFLLEGEEGVTLAEQVDTWLVRSRRFSGEELARARMTAMRIANPDFPNREAAFQSFIERLSDEIVTREGKAAGHSAEETSVIVKEGLELLQESNRLLAQSKLYGTISTETQAGEIVTRTATEPLASTQLLNKMMGIDPLEVRRILRGNAWTVRRFNNVIRRVVRNPTEPITAGSKAMRYGMKLDRIASGWRRLVITRPGYVVRVVLIDENLRIASTIGLLEHFEGTATGAKLLSFVDRHLPRGQEKSVIVRGFDGNIEIPMGRAGLEKGTDLVNTSAGHRGLLESMGEEERRISRDVGTTGAWTAVHKGDANYLSSWGNDLNRQFGQDPAMRLMLDDIANGHTMQDSIRRTVATLTEDQGYAASIRHITAKPMVEGMTKREAIQAWADKAAPYVWEYTAGGDADLARAALGSVVNADMLRGIPEARQPLTVHGPELELINTQGESIWHKGLETISRAILETPTNVWNRQPFYKVWKGAMREGLLENSAAMGRTVTTSAELADKVRLEQELSARLGVASEHVPEAAKWTPAPPHPGNPYTSQRAYEDAGMTEVSDYAYHATESQSLSSIAEEGLRIHEPSYGTDQQVWPDGATEHRSYFVQNPDHAYQFTPGDLDSGALLRVKKSEVSLRREGTGDLYSRTPIPASKIEVYGSDGEWHPVTEMGPPSRVRTIESSSSFAKALERDLPNASPDIFGQTPDLTKAGLEAHGPDAVYRAMSQEEWNAAQRQGYIQGGGYQKAAKGDTYLSTDPANAAGYATKAYRRAFAGRKNAGFVTPDESVLVVVKDVPGMKKLGNTERVTSERIPLDRVEAVYHIKVRPESEEATLARVKAEYGIEVASRKVVEPPRFSTGTATIDELKPLRIQAEEPLDAPGMQAAIDRARAEGIQPVTVAHDLETGKYFVQDGHHSLQIAEAMGIREVPTILQEWRGAEFIREVPPTRAPVRPETITEPGTLGFEQGQKQWEREMAQTGPGEAHLPAAWMTDEQLNTHLHQQHGPDFSRSGKVYKNKVIGGGTSPETLHDIAHSDFVPKVPHYHGAHAEADFEKELLGGSAHLPPPGEVRGVVPLTPAEIARETKIKLGQEIARSELENPKVFERQFGDQFDHTAAGIEEAIASQPDSAFIKTADRYLAHETGAGYKTTPLDEVRHPVLPGVNKTGELLGARDRALATQQLEDLRAKIGNSITREKIDAQAHRFAQGQVRHILYDLRDQGRLGEMLRFVVPFFQPWLEAFLVWGRILAQNPAVLGYLYESIHQGIQSGFLRRDPTTGGLMIPMSNFLGAAPLMSALGLMPGGTHLSAPLTGFNLLFNSTVPVPTGGFAGNLPLPFPGFSPWATWAIQKMASNESVPSGVRNWLTSFAFAYGPTTAGSFIPRWMQYGIMGITHGQVNQQAWDATVHDFQVLQQYHGIGPRLDEPPPGITDEGWATMSPKEKFNAWNVHLVALAEHDTREFYFGRTLISMFFPSAPKIDLPFQPLRDELDALRKKEGVQKGTEDFIKRHPDMTLLTIGKGMWDREFTPPGFSVTPSKALLQFMQLPGFQDAVKRHPALWWALIPHEVRDAPFDLNAYFALFGQGYMVSRPPENTLPDSDVSKGWDDYFTIRQWYDNWTETHLDQGPGDPAYEAEQQKYNNAIADNRRVHPIWADRYDTFSSKRVDASSLGWARHLMDDPIYARTEVGSWLKGYIPLLDHTLSELEAHNIHTLDSNAARTLGLTQNYQTTVDALNKQYPDGKLAYEAFFSDAVQAEATSGEKALNGLSKDQIESLAIHTTEWQTALHAPAMADPGPDKLAAFLKIRQLADDAFSLPDSENWLLQWWNLKNDTQEQNDYRISLMGRPYEFLSRFDRQVVLGETTSDSAEASWLTVAQDQISIAKLRQAEPLAPVAPMYNALDAVVTDLAAKDPVFATQVEHSNEWGYQVEKMLPFVAKGSDSQPYWAEFLDNLRSVQAVVDKPVGVDSMGQPVYLHGSDIDIDPKKDAMWKGLKQVLISRRDDLFSQNPQFRREWNQLEDMNGYDSLIDYLMPNAYFPLGGYGMTAQAAA